MSCFISSPYCGDMILGVLEESRNPRVVSTHRLNPLVMGQRAWTQLHEPFIRQQEQAMEQLHDEQYRKYLKEGSDAMCAQWVDSVKNVRMRVDAAILEHKAQKIEKQLAKIRELDEAKENQRQEFCDKIKKILCYDKNGPRDLTRALLLSHVIKERDTQVAFKEEIKKKNKEKDIAEGKFRHEDAEKFIAEQTGKTSEALRVKRALWRELRETADEIQRQADESSTAETNKCIEDIRRAQEEYARVKEFERKFKEQERQTFIRNYETETRRDQLRADKIKKIDEIDQSIADTYFNARRRIDKLQIETRIKKTSEYVARCEETAKKVFRPYDAYDEQAAHQKADKEEAEIYLKMDARERAKAELRWRELDDRRIAYENCRAENARLAYETKHRKNWEMLNNFKQREISDEYEERKRLRRKAEMALTERVLSEQMELKKKLTAERAAEENEKDRIETIVTFNISDKFFFECAKDVQKEVEEKGLASYPIQKAIHIYKSESGLLPPEEKYKNYKKKLN